MTLFIHGIGTAVPPFSIAQEDAADIARNVHPYTADQKRLLPVLYRRAGVRTRHSVVLETDSGPLTERQHFFPIESESCRQGPGTGERMAKYEKAAGGLATTAADRALADAALAPRNVTDLITVSCSGFCAPGFDIALIRDLGLPNSVSRTHVGFMGCHGALNALRIARATATANPKACVLICCVELCSLHHQYAWDPEQMVANALFADGAAAAICLGVREERRKADRATGENPGNAWELVDNGTVVVPETTDAMGWRIGDNGFRMTLSPRVPELIHQNLRPWLQSWLSRHGLTPEAVPTWGVHPGGPRILSACLESLSFPRERLADSFAVLSEYGNMSSPTVLFILSRLKQKNAPSPCVLLGFGPGLTIEAGLFRTNDSLAAQ